MKSHDSPLGQDVVERLAEIVRTQHETPRPAHAEYEVQCMLAQGGMGLGLALSKYWAGCLGGSLMLKRSRRIGSDYSRFSLSLPSKS